MYAKFSVCAENPNELLHLPKCAVHKNLNCIPFTVIMRGEPYRFFLENWFQINNC